MIEVAWSTETARIRIERTTPRYLAVLRIRKPTAEAVGTVETELGLALPRRPNCREGTAPAALWLGPTEWMIVGETPLALERSPQLVAGAVHLADVTDGWVVYRASGPDAGELLAKGCTLDFHPRSFSAGRCAQSALAQVFVVVERRN